MQKRRSNYTVKHMVSSVFMILALAWLTVSTPFVYSAQQQQKALEAMSQCADETEENYNPFASTNEEKTESGPNTLSEEYLHEAPHFEHHFIILVKFYKCHPSDEYIAFKPEFVSPPPEA